MQDLTSAIEALEEEHRSTAASLATEKATSRRRHLSLVDELTKAVATRDALSTVMRRLETLSHGSSSVSLGPALEVRDAHMPPNND